MAREWGLTNLTALTGLTHHFILEGYRKTQPVILKLGPDTITLEKEAQILDAFGPGKAISVLEKQKGVLLLQRAIPGYSLRSLFPENDLQAAAILGGLMTNLHKTPLKNHDHIPRLKDWLAVFDHTWDLPGGYLEKARKVRDRLCDSLTDPVLLHGDLHHDNIVRNKDKWVIIDPKGVVGNRLFDIAAFVCNPLPDLVQEPCFESILEKRLYAFANYADAGIRQIRDVCFMQNCLAWIWCLEDGVDPTPFKEIAGVMQHFS